jgi:hypothetical protein
MHTVGQGTEEGHRGLALDTLRVAGQRQHGKQPTASHRQHESSTYVSRCRCCLFVVVVIIIIINVVPPLLLPYVSLYIYFIFFLLLSVIVLFSTSSSLLAHLSRSNRISMVCRTSPYAWLNTLNGRNTYPMYRANRC